MHANLCDSPFDSSGSVFCGPTQVNLEVQEAAILLDGHDFGNIEMSCIQKLELASQVEVQESLHGAMRSDDARLHTCVLYGLLHFSPMSVMPDLWSSRGKGKLFSGLSRILRARVHDHVGCFFRRKRVQRLMVFFREREVQSNAFEVYLHAVAAIISKSDLYGDDSCREWRLLRKLLLIECGIGPRPRRNGHALVGFQRSGLERRRLLGDSLLGSQQPGGEKGKDEGLFSLRVIRDFFHLEAFYSWGLCRV